MAYSSGFNPHPRIAYATAAPTSAASEAEYVELGLWERCDPAKIVDALNESLPAGFVVLDAAEALPTSMGDLLQASRWELALADVDERLFAAAVEQFVAAESVTVERMTKNGLREFEARQAVLTCEPVGAKLRILLRHTVPLVRPDDVLTGLRGFEPSLPEQALLTRLEQGVLADGEILDPLRAAETRAL